MENVRSPKSGLPNIAATSGVIRSDTSALTSAANAAPITNAIASAIKLPPKTNPLNSSTSLRTAGLPRWCANYPHAVVGHEATTHTADPIPTLEVCDFGPGAFRAPAWSARSEIRSFSAPGLKSGRLGPPAWKPHVMPRFADIRPLLCVLVAVLAASCAVWATPAAAARDLDRDGVPNSRDRNVDGDAFQNAHDTDIDGDGARNGHDRDVDGDGVPNSRDREIDGDGAPNRRDSDMDGDRVPNRFDRDMDGDGLRNARDPDSDTDGLSSVARLHRRVRLQRSFFGIDAPQAHAVEGTARRSQLEQIKR